MNKDIILNYCLSVCMFITGYILLDSAKQVHLTGILYYIKPICYFVSSTLMISSLTIVVYEIEKGDEHESN